MVWYLLIKEELLMVGFYVKNDFNGELYGECCCSTLDVYENGFLQGEVSYRFLEIRNGGCITGIVNKVTDEVQNNVSELVKARES